MSEAKEDERGGVGAGLWAGPAAVGVFAVVVAGLLVWKVSAENAEAGGAIAGMTLDLNSASEGELALLPRIGPGLAKRIVEYRSEHGPFESVEELSEVPGMGERATEALRPYLRVGN